MDPGLSYQVFVTGYTKDRAEVQGRAVVSYHWGGWNFRKLLLHNFIFLTCAVSGQKKKAEISILDNEFKKQCCLKFPKLGCNFWQNTLLGKVDIVILHSVIGDSFQQEIISAAKNRVRK